MSNRKHLRGPRALYGRLTFLSALTLLVAAPTFAQDTPAADDEPAAANAPDATAADASADEATDTAAEVTATDAPSPEDAGEAPVELERDTSDRRPIFLVTEMTVEEGVAISADAARDALAARFGRFRDKLDVRSFGEVKATIDQQALSALLGGEAADLDKLGGYVDADRVVFGRVHKVGDITEVSVRVFNVRESAMEIVMSRRIKAGAADSLVLTAVDGLADRLAAWSLTTYGNDAPSAEFEAMKKKTVRRKKAKDEPEVASADASPWSFMGVGGAGLAGVGLGTIVAGAAMIAVDSQKEAIAPTIVMASGGAVFLGGMTLVIIDGIE